MRVYKFGYIGTPDFDKLAEQFKDIAVMKECDGGDREAEIEATEENKKRLVEANYLTKEEAKEDVDYYLFYEI